MTTTRSLTLDYLQNLLAQGCQRLAVDDEARGILRQWMLAAKNGTPLPRPAATAAGQPQAARPAQVQAPAPARAQAPSPAPATGGVDLSTLDTARREQVETLRAAMAEELPKEDAYREEDEIPFFRPGGATAEEVWVNFRRLLPVWKPLRELGTLRQAAVFGEGALDADIMFVGDAPNYHDERAGRPFQGEAGGKLDGMLKAMGLSRQQVYITHFVKFRPALPRQTFNNRPPNEKEMVLSAPVVELEARLVRPKVIVALGVIAARGLLGMQDLPLSAYQQRRGTFCNIPVVVTHHPSYLLRTSDLAERRRLWEEMLLVMEMTGLPISEKQRRYFLK